MNVAVASESRPVSMATLVMPLCGVLSWNDLQQLRQCLDMSTIDQMGRTHDEEAG